MFYFLFVFFFIFGSVSSAFGEWPKPIEAAKESIVKIIDSVREQKQLAKIGIFVKDEKGRIMVMTLFHVIDDHTLREEIQNVFVEYENRIFILNQIKSVDPLNNLVLLKWDEEWEALSKKPLKLKKPVKPLSLRESPLQEGESFYMLGFSSDISNNLVIHKIKNMQYIKGLDYLSFLSETAFLSYSFLSSVILDQEGRLVTVLNINEQNHGLGTPTQYIKNLVKGASFNCSSSVRGCILRARKMVYNEAKRGNPKAQQQLAGLMMVPAYFKKFMQSIGITDDQVLKNDMKSFTAGMIQAYLGPSLYSLIEKEPDKKEVFIKRSVQLAKENYPPAQYFMGERYRSSRFFKEAVHYFEKAAEYGFFPAYKALIEMYNSNEGNIRSKISPKTAINWRTIAYRFGYNNCTSIFPARNRKQQQSLHSGF